MFDFTTFVTLIWLIYMVVHWIYERFTYKYLAERLIVFDTPPRNPAKRPKEIPLRQGDWLKIFSHEYDQRFVIYYSRPVASNLEQIAKNIYPSIVKSDINTLSIYSSIELYRDERKVWEMYIHEADGLILQKYK